MILGLIVATNMSQKYKQLFADLSTTIDSFVEMVRSKKSTLMATDQWSVKDVLCHVVFWHQLYAANYKSLAERRTPVIPEYPAYKLNLPGVKSLRKYSIKNLVSLLDSAHKSLFVSIIKNNVPRMTYNKGGVVYETEDFLKGIARHIATHTKQIRAAKEKR